MIEQVLTLTRVNYAQFLSFGTKLYQKKLRTRIFTTFGGGERIGMLLSGFKEDICVTSLPKRPLGRHETAQALNGADTKTHKSTKSGLTAAWKGEP